MRYVDLVDLDGPVGNDARDIAVQILFRRDERERAEGYLRAGGLPADMSDPRFSDVTVAFRVSLSLRAQADGDFARALALGKILDGSSDGGRVWTGHGQGRAPTRRHSDRNGCRIVGDEFLYPRDRMAAHSAEPSSTGTFGRC